MAVKVAVGVSSPSSIVQGLQAEWHTLIEEFLLWGPKLLTLSEECGFTSLSFSHRYFSLQATHPLGFDDVVRLEIESNICREGGPLPNCFTTPLRQAWTTMEKVPRTSQVLNYKEFLLMNSENVAWERAVQDSKSRIFV